jgi:hypothetical protein
MKIPPAFELLKQLVVVFFSVIWTIILNNWQPFYTTLVKVSIISLVIWGLVFLIPHGILLLSEISYLGWFTIILVYRLVTMKYDDFEEIEENSEPIQIPLDEEPEAQLPPNVIAPAQNIISKKEREVLNDPNASTRE